MCNSKNNFHFDAIGVLGNSFYIQNGECMLTHDSKWRVLAADQAWKEGKSINFVFLGGRTKGDKYPSEAELMNKYLKHIYDRYNKNFERIPENKIILEDKSKSTVSNMINFKLIAEKNGWIKLAIITSSYHIARSQKRANLIGLNVTPISAESLLLSRNKEKYSKLCEVYYHSSKVKNYRLMESFLLLEAKIDKKGKLIDKIADILRK